MLVQIWGTDKLRDLIICNVIFAVQIRVRGCLNLGLNKFIEKLKNSYMDNKTGHTKAPDFKSSSFVRKRVVFSGKVQGVGFRYEIRILAEQLDLTGWVRNKNRNKVELEVQGKKDKILFLVSHMKSLKRAVVTHVEINEIPIINGEIDFIVKYS